jgi:hypothetical protein
MVRLGGTGALCGANNADHAWVIPNVNGVTVESARSLLSVFTAARLANRNVIVNAATVSGICVVWAVEI